MEQKGKTRQKDKGPTIKCLSITYIQMCVYFPKKKIGNTRPQQQTSKMAKWKGNRETPEKHYAKDMKTGKGQVKSSKKGSGINTA